MARRNAPSLQQVQADFQAYILGRDEVMPGLVRTTSKATPVILLGVYRDAYVLRLLEALETNHPALKRMLGDPDFDRLGRAYIARHPSRHFSIRWFGSELAAFAGATPPWAERPAVIELIRFEWALSTA